MFCSDAVWTSKKSLDYSHRCPSIHESVINDLDNNNVCAIFLDLAKACDTYNHKTLLLKLEQQGIKGIASDVI